MQVPKVLAFDFLIHPTKHKNWVKLEFIYKRGRVWQFVRWSGDQTNFDLIIATAT